MSNTVTHRSRIVRRSKADNGQQILTLTGWNLVRFSGSGEMLEPVSTKVGVSVFNDANFPVNDFLVIDRDDRLPNGHPLPNINTPQK